MEKPKKNIRVVAAVIFKDKSVYCFQRGQNKYKYLTNKFEFPGGKIEVGESKKSALKREILEELNIDILVKNELIEIEHEYPDFIVNMSCFACTIIKGKINLREHKKFVVKDICKLSDLEWLPADLPVIDYLMENF